MTKRLKEEGNDRRADGVLHYNLDAVNNSRFPKVFAVTQKAGPILGARSREYMCAVERLVISGSTIPLMTIPENTYYVGIASATDRAISPLLYVARDKRYNLNTIFQYTELADAITAAFALAFAACGGKPVGVTLAPQMIYNKVNGTYALLYPDNYDSEGMHIYMNTRLFGLFGNFLSNYSPDNFNYEYELLPDRADGMNVSNTVAGGKNTLVADDMVYCSQEYEALFNIQEFTSIVFKSTKLGLHQEYAQGPNTSGDQLVINNQSSGLPSAVSMLTDLIPYLSSGDRAGIRGYQYYAPDNKRWIGLTIDEIDEIDVNIYIRNKVGEEIPYFIPPFQTASMKLIFAEKKYISC